MTPKKAQEIAARAFVFHDRETDVWVADSKETKIVAQGPTAQEARESLVRTIWLQDHFDAALALASKHGMKDARTFAEENPGEVAQCLEPGQLGADEALINALGSAKVAKLFGLDSPEAPAYQTALSAYSRAHLTELVRIHSRSEGARRAGSATSDRKARAVRRNGKKGGRPVGSKDSKPRTRVRAEKR